jgi:predicted MPP superfamily phosphohydrolase
LFALAATGDKSLVNWGWLLVRIAIGLTVLACLILSQRFWYRAVWRLTSNLRSLPLRVAVRLVYVAALLAVILATADGIRMGHARLIPRGSMITALAGLWLVSALFAWLGVKAIHGLERAWRRLRISAERRKLAAKPAPAGDNSSAVELLADPSRRYFFRTVTAVAGATPFLGAVYGFAAERLRYRVLRVEIPIANLPPALDGLRIVQLSDVHMSGYMTREQVRRAVGMANGLAADLAVITGDFITGASDPLADCIEELRELRAPLGAWGCNGNHEIYAQVEDSAQRLFAQAGMKLLRQENTQLSWRGAQFNLIGVDYQRERSRNGHRLPMLAHLAPLVRRDIPNILLSHNPNAFNRAAELGIELTLSGHTHGGQVQVEILDHRFSPARFITDYIAGLYQRPLLAPAPSDRASASATFALDPSRDSPLPSAALYVNRGLGTVGAPVRIGVPPEITLVVLRRA